MRFFGLRQLIGHIAKGDRFTDKLSAFGWQKKSSTLLYFRHRYLSDLSDSPNGGKGSTSLYLSRVPWLLARYMRFFGLRQLIGHIAKGEATELG
jgi:hypothetical protein